MGQSGAGQQNRPIKIVPNQILMDTLAKLPLLFAPITFGDITLRNRVLVSPMCQYNSNGEGSPWDYHLVHLGQFAMGGAGLVFCEETAVEYRG